MRPARCAGIMEEARSSQEAFTHSVEARTAGGPKKKQDLCRIFAFVTKGTEPTSMRRGVAFPSTRLSKMIRYYPATGVQTEYRRQRVATVKTL